MSAYLFGPVWGITTLSVTEKVVLLRLADCANENGENAWPSVARMAAECSVSARAVQYALKSLTAAGHLEVQEPPGDHRPTTYRVIVERRSVMPAFHPTGMQEGGCLAPVAGCNRCGAQQVRGARASIAGCNRCAGGVHQLQHPIR